MNFKIIKAGKSKWTFAAISSNGKVLAKGGAYARRRDAVRGVTRFCDSIWDGKYEIESVA